MTKKILKVLKTMLYPTLAFAVLAIAFAKPSVAANNADAQVNALDQSAVSAIIVGGTGKSDLAHLYYIGSQAEALVTIAGGSISFFAPATVADTSIGSSGVVTYASTLGANTAGSLCDYINASTNYRCRLTGALRGDTATNLFKTQTETSGTCGLQAAGGCTLTNEDAGVIRVGIIPANGRRVVLTQAQSIGVVATDKVNVYGVLRKNAVGHDNLGVAASADSNVWSQSVAGAGTLGYMPSQYTLGPWVEFAPNVGGYTSKNPPIGSSYDGRVVVGVGEIGSNQVETSADQLQVLWSEK